MRGVFGIVSIMITIEDNQRCTVLPDAMVAFMMVSIV